MVLVNNTYTFLCSQEVNSRKHVQLMTSQVAKKDTQVKHETFYSHKFSKRLADQNRREHEDHLKHFSVSSTPFQSLPFP